ncbi:MAG: hypothetical protein EBU66_10735 [Bacteroidetes bacterium]|nr:hypothetical protein [bacterium]NBP65115.1 hypothetical protein [Bacteroidota bacterium]
MPTPSEVNLNIFKLGEPLTYYPNMNTPPITLIPMRNGTKEVLVPINDANTQINSLPELSRYAWNLDPTHKNPDGTLKKYGGSMNMKNIKFYDGTSVYDKVNPVSSV